MSLPHGTGAPQLPATPVVWSATTITTPVAANSPAVLLTKQNAYSALLWHAKQILHRVFLFETHHLHRRLTVADALGRHVAEALDEPVTVVLTVPPQGSPPGVAASIEELVTQALSQQDWITASTPSASDTGCVSSCALPTELRVLLLQVQSVAKQALALCQQEHRRKSVGKSKSAEKEKSRKGRRAVAKLHMERAPALPSGGGASSRCTACSERVSILGSVSPHAHVHDSRRTPGPAPVLDRAGGVAGMGVDASPSGGPGTSNSSDNQPANVSSSVYSSEDSGTGFGGRRGSRRHRGGLQGSDAVEQFLLALAFSCPCAPLSAVVRAVLLGAVRDTAAGDAAGAPAVLMQRHEFLHLFVAPSGSASTRVGSLLELPPHASPGCATPVLGEQTCGGARSIKGAGEAPRWSLVPPPYSLALDRLARDLASLDQDLLDGSTATAAVSVLRRVLTSSADDTAGGGHSTLSPTRRLVIRALLRSQLAVPYRTFARSRRELLFGIFEDARECSHYYQLLSLFPRVLQAHHVSMQYIFADEGPLHTDERFMIAIMAASRHQCEYLVRRFSAMLLRYSEENRMSWLEHGPPEKLAALQTIVGLAAHLPWQLRMGHFKDLLQGGLWNIPELCHAISVIASTLSLCSFTMGLLVPNDVWTAAALPFSFWPPSQRGIFSKVGGGPLGAEHPSFDYTRFTGLDDIVSERRINGSSGGNPNTVWGGCFNWHNNGGSLMEQYYPGAAALLNEELDAFEDVVRQMEEVDCVGLKGTDYTPSYAFRSLRLYVQNIMGFMEEDYAYNEINRVLRRGPKQYAHVSTMYPETLNPELVRRWASTLIGSSSGGSDLSSTTGVSEAPIGISDQEWQLCLLGEVRTGGSSPSNLAFPSAEDVVGGDACRNPPDVLLPSPEEVDRAVSVGLGLQEERLVLLVALATMEARKEGLLTLMLHPVWEFQSNM